MSQPVRLPRKRWKTELNEEGKLTQQKDKLFEPASTKLKSWAKEKFSYIQETLSVITCLKSQLEAVKNEIQQTHEELAKRHKFSLASAERRRKRKRPAIMLRRPRKENLKHREKEVKMFSASSVAPKKCCLKLPRQTTEEKSS